jgi:formamidopyrimidine-DNA glycosylase
MPELPEVETIARVLRLGAPAQTSVLGRAIDQVNVLWDRSIAVPSAAEFAAQAQGQRITEIGRRGKFLRLDLNREVLLVHLRMSGDFYPQEIQNELSPYARVVFRLDDGRWLVFQDSRKFGRMWLTDDANTVLGKLGPEPFSPELTPEIFYNRLISHHRQLKPLLLDQHFLAGMGNIYTDEALHLAQLHPLLRSDTLTKMQAERLLGAIRSTLSAGIQRNGTSIDWVYRGGDYQRFLTVYKQTGSPCKNCGTPIARFMVGQRSTHYCPNCQKNPDPP